MQVVQKDWVVNHRSNCDWLNQPTRYNQFMDDVSDMATQFSIRIDICCG